MGTINFAWWNLQNFFDTVDDEISKDFEYTPEFGWTEAAFRAKKKNLAKVLKALHGDAESELLAVCEIEHDELLKELIAEMGSEHLKVVDDPSVTPRDYRGIDVAMAYDERKLKVVRIVSHIVYLRYRTRDIFEVEFEVKATGEKLVVIAGHWPSRWKGKYRTQPLRIAVAEHVAYLVESHVKVEPSEYEELRAEEDLAPVTEKWETKVMVVGDLNDEPGDRSIVEHLKASNDLDRVVGRTNDIDGFEDETADYRAQDVFLYNPMWKFLPQENVGTYFINSTQSWGKFTNRYQVLDQVVISRGLLSGSGLRLDPDSVAIFRESVVATGSGRPRKFEKKSKKGMSDHLPVTAILKYD